MSNLCYDCQYQICIYAIVVDNDNLLVIMCRHCGASLHKYSRQHEVLIPKVKNRTSVTVLAIMI